MSRSLKWIALAALVLPACSESLDLEPADTSLSVVVTEAMSADELGPALMAEISPQSPAGSFAFVSLPPGSFPAGRSARLTNEARGAAVTATMREGGFDPVPVAAEVGDEIVVEILDGAVVLARTTVTIPPDRSPVIVRTEPSQRRTAVPLNVLPRVIFSEPIDPRTVVAANVRLTLGGTEVAAELALLDAGVTVEVRPAQMLDPAASYELTIETGVRDLSGNAVEAAALVEFTTGTDVNTIEFAADTATVPAGAMSLLPVSINGVYIDTYPADSAIEFSSSDETVLQVFPDGSFFGVQPGEAWIFARFGGALDSALVIVTTSPPPGPFRVFPDGWYASTGNELLFDVSHPVGTERPDVAWSVSDTRVITVDATGNVTATGPGLAWVIGTAGDLVDSAEVRIIFEVKPDSAYIDVGESIDFYTIADPDGNEAEVTWTSTNPDVATVDANGVATGLATGVTFIQAESANAVNTAILWVNYQEPQPPVSMVELSPDAITVSEGHLIALSLETIGVGTEYEGVVPTVESLSPDIVEPVEPLTNLGPNMVALSFRAVKKGTAAIVARYGTLSDTTLVTVVERPGDNQ